MEMKSTPNQPIIKLIDETFKEEPEVFEVCMYAMSTLAIQYEILAGMLLGKTELRGIPPEAYHLMRRFDNGMTQNQFYLESFAPIKIMLGMDDIRLNTMRQFIAQGERTGEKHFFEQAKSFMFSRFDVLTTIAQIWKGVTFAEEFHSKLHAVVELGPELEAYFNERGV